MRRDILLLLSVLFSLAFLGAVFAARFLPLRVCLIPETVEQVRQCVERVEARERALQTLARYSGSQPLKDALALFDTLKPFQGDLGYFLGEGGEVTYMVLLQNDTELKTSGGFSGSYAVITLKDGVPEFRFQDIYVPDGQIEGYIVPPKPIQEAFLKGSWYLRDWDWNPDFVSGSQTLRWFMQKGGEKPADIVMTLGLRTIERVMQIIGDVRVPEYDVTLTSENVYDFLQSEAEVDFFPGSTQKRDALTAVGNALIPRFAALNWRQKLAIGRVLVEDLERGNILVNSGNKHVQKTLEVAGWAGSFVPVPCMEAGCLADTVSIIEANMGANKANCCVERITTHEVTFDNDRILHTIKVRYRNTSLYQNPIKPYFYGGNYIAYIRLYVPMNASDVSVSARPSFSEDVVHFSQLYENGSGKLDISQTHGFTELGFFHTTQAGGESSFQLRYALPNNHEVAYQLAILKQHGLRESVQTGIVFDESFETDLTDDFVIVETFSER